MSIEDIYKTRQLIDGMGDKSNSFGLQVNEFLSKYSRKIKFATTIATFGTITAAIGFFAGLKGRKID